MAMTASSGGGFAQGQRPKFRRPKSMFSTAPSSGQDLMGTTPEANQDANQGIGGTQGLPSFWDLKQNYTGKGGLVNVNPLTGESIAKEDKVSPARFFSEYMVDSPALQKAQNFQFANLGENLAPQAAQGMLSAGQNLFGGGQSALGAGQNLLNAGQNITNSAVQNLLGTQGQIQGTQSQVTGERGQALNELQQLQRQALSPELSPEQRQYFQDIADQRRADILSRFGEGGDIQQIFQKQRNADVANLASKGVLDSTTASNTMANRDTQLAALANQLLGNANEQSIQDMLTERARTSQAATSFGGLQSGQATSGLSGLLGLLGQQSDIGQNIGQIGLGQQNTGIAQQGIGAQLAGLGLQGLQGGANTSLAGREQEANLQLGELGQQLIGSQTALQNLQSLINSRFGRKMTKEQLDLLKQQINNQPGLFGQIAGAALGGLGGALI